MSILVKQFAAAIGLAAAFLPLQAQEFRNNNRDIAEPFVVSADSVLALGGVVPVDALQATLSEPNSFPFKLKKAEKKAKKASEIYTKAMAATVVVGSAYLCPRCAHTHVNNASGYIIHEDGVVVTNYHVIEGYFNMDEGNKPLALLARLSDGRTYPVKEILCASERDDLAVLRLDTENNKLPALSLSKRAAVGEDAYVLGHPKGMFYFFTKGIVNSKFQEAMGRDQNRGARDIMAVSADYAAGSSGGPVLDAKGNIIGTVSSTRTLQYNDPGKSVQMVLKATIPVESLWKLIGPLD